MKNRHRSVKVLRRGDLARLTGCNLETIRYYENIGVMPEPPRSSKNYRVYDDRHVARLCFIMRARELGFTLDEVRDLLALVDGGAQTCGEVQGWQIRISPRSAPRSTISNASNACCLPPWRNAPVTMSLNAL